MIPSGPNANAQDEVSSSVDLNQLQVANEVIHKLFSSYIFKPSLDQL